MLISIPTRDSGTVLVNPAKVLWVCKNFIVDAGFPTLLQMPGLAFECSLSMEKLLALLNGDRPKTEEINVVTGIEFDAMTSTLRVKQRLVEFVPKPSETVAATAELAEAILAKRLEEGVAPDGARVEWPAPGQSPRLFRWICLARHGWGVLWPDGLRTLYSPDFRTPIRNLRIGELEQDLQVTEWVGDLPDGIKQQPQQIPTHVVIADYGSFEHSYSFEASCIEDALQQFSAFRKASRLSGAHMAGSEPPVVGIEVRYTGIFVRRPRAEASR